MKHDDMSKDTCRRTRPRTRAGPIVNPRAAQKPLHFAQPPGPPHFPPSHCLRFPLPRSQASTFPALRSASRMQRVQGA